MPAVVLSDKALSEVVKHVNRITSVEYLKLELEKAGLLIQSSLLSEEYLGILFFAIEGAVKEVIKATVTGTSLITLYTITDLCQLVHQKFRHRRWGFQSCNRSQAAPKELPMFQQSLCWLKLNLSNMRQILLEPKLTHSESQIHLNPHWIA